MSGSDFGVILLFFLIIIFVSIPVNLEIWRDRVERYDLYMPKDRKHKPRMKYLTGLSCEEVLLRLMQMYAPFGCTFEKANADPKDQMYVLSIDEVPLRYHGMFRGGVKYKVLVTPTQEGSAVWLFLFSFDKTPWLSRDLFHITRFTDDEMLNVFAWEVEKLFEKLLEAVRVE